MTLRDDPNYLFTLRVRLDVETTLVVHAFEAGRQGPHHTRVDVVADITRSRCGHSDCAKYRELASACKASGAKRLVTRERIWTRGETCVGIPGHSPIDGDYTKEAALSLLSMKPGDTDAEFFEGWTEAQLAFAERWGDELSMIKRERYGDL